MCELDPLYCDRIVRRWQGFAKDDAVLESSGRRFEDVRLDRQQKSIGLVTRASQVEHANANASDELTAASQENEAEQYHTLSPILDFSRRQEANRWDGWHD